MSRASERPASDTAPCVGCGLCCDGTLFIRAKVTPGEEARLGEHGLRLIADKDRTFFSLPCHHHSCGSCTIYATRFDICHSFRCALLRRYQAGDLSVEQAKATVEEAHRLVAKVQAADRSAGLLAERQTLRQSLSGGLSTMAPAERRAAAGRLLNMIALDTFLDRWFRNPKAAGQTESADDSRSNS